MITLTEYQRLQRNVEEKKREADKAEGAFEAALKRLKDEFDCATAEDAKKLLAKLTREAEEAEREFEELFDQLQKDYPNVVP